MALTRLGPVPRLLLLLSLGGCARTYHPEFHPESHYAFVQNITYGAPAETDRCKLGRTSECWRACFHRSEGEACYLLGVMFETGHGVPKSHADAQRLAGLARALGYAPAVIDVEMAAPYLDLWGHDPKRSAPPSRAGSVTSTGGVVVYGSAGDIYLGK